jgi:hypothetical protein
MVGVKEPQTQFIIGAASKAPLPEQLIGLLLMMQTAALYIVVHRHAMTRG